MHPLYKDLILAQAQAAVAAAQSVNRVPHAGLKGQLREIVVRELLRPLLPSDLAIGTGQIVSAYGDVSNQLDIVVCDRKLVPPILFGSSRGIFPLEATLFTVEVKSTLDAGKLKKTHESALKVSMFRHAPPVGSTEWDPAHKIEHVVPYLIAFDSDLKVGGKSEIDRYDEIRQGVEPAVRGLCVVRRGFWFWADGGWHQWPLPAPAAFIAAIINTYQRIANTRRQPDFRQYLFDEQNRTKTLSLDS